MKMLNSLPEIHFNIVSFCVQMINECSLDVFLKQNLFTFAYYIILHFFATVVVKPHIMQKVLLTLLGIINHSLHIH